MIKWNVKDGGPESPVTYYGIELKCLFSIGFIKFKKGRREAYHTHAFHALTWFLKGDLIEERIVTVSRISTMSRFKTYSRSILPKFTSRDNLHRVRAVKDSWCFTIRGPWSRMWKEFNPKSGMYTVFTHGREILGTYPVT